MKNGMRVGIVCAFLCAGAGLAEAKTPAAGVPIDGNWHATGKVIVARHIANVKVGDQVTRTWSIKSRCTKKPAKCTTTLSYHTSGGKQIRLALRGGKKGNWSGTLEKQTFECTNSATATGSISFKLHVTSFTKHLKRRVAAAMTGRGVQSGTGCAAGGVKEVVTFKISRTAF